MTKRTDTDPELLIYPWQNGVRLYRPDARFKPLDDSVMSIGSALSMPCNVFFMDADSKMVSANDSTIASFNKDSFKEIKGKNVRELLPSNYASVPIHHDKLVMQTKFKHIVEEDANEHLHFLVVKVPWYNLQNEVVGVFGCATTMNPGSLSENLTSFIQLGLLNRTNTNSYFKTGLYLTQKEINILHYLKFGKVAREISEMCGNSKRTVEHHIENIKQKLNVFTHSQLVEMAQILTR